MKDTARAASLFGVEQVNGFTGSSIWHMLYSFPPNDFDEIERGYQDFAGRWGPIMDVFAAEGVRFGLEVHPTEIATTSSRRARPSPRSTAGRSSGSSPENFAHQFLDSAAFVEEFASVSTTYVKDSRKTLDGRSSSGAISTSARWARLGLRFAGTAMSTSSLFRSLNRIGYGGPSRSVGGLRMDRDWEAPGRARVRPPHGLRAVGDRLRRGDAALGRMSAA
jgi:hypothetical protein